MFNFLKKLIKWFIVYPIAACAAIALVLVISGYEPTGPVEVASTPEVKSAPAPVVKKTKELAGVYKTCFLNKQHMDYQNNPGLKFFIKADGKFGKYDDGEIWVGYTRKVFPDGAVLGDSKTYRNQRVICKSNGQAY